MLVGVSRLSLKTLNSKRERYAGSLTYYVCLEVCAASADGLACLPSFDDGVYILLPW